MIWARDTQCRYSKHSSSVERKHHHPTIHVEVEDKLTNIYFFLIKERQELFQALAWKAVIIYNSFDKHSRPPPKYSVELGEQSIT